MRIPTLILAAAIVAAPAAAQAPKPILPTPLTLDAAIRIALANQNLVAIAESRKAAAEAGVTQARSAYYPSITPNYRYSNQHTAFNAGEGTRTGTITQSTTSIDLTQTIFDMGKREQNVARAKDSVRSAGYSVEDVRQDVILDVSTDWYTLLRSQELVRVAESGSSRAETTLEATQAFVDAGTAARKDVLQAQADYDNAQVQVLQARNSVRLAQTALKNAMGVVTTQPIETPSAPPPAPDKAPDATTVPDYIQMAYNNRPDLMSAKADISSSKHNVALARIEAGPQLTSTLSAGYRVHPDPGFDRTFGIGVSYPLFDAGSSRAAVRSASAGVRQAEQQLELAKQNIAADVESAYLSREEARARIGVTQAALTASRENFAAASESRKEGAGNILDVITAQNQLVTAETNAVQAVYDFYDANARLARAIGRNDQSSPSAGAPATEPSTTS